MILSQIAGYSIVHLIVVAIILAACVGILVVVFRQFGVAVPPFVVQIFWIVVACALAIFAIRFIASM